jgi:hypothetical protein
MADENNVQVVEQEQTQVSDDTTQSQVESQQTDVDVDDVEAKIADLQAQLAKQQEIVEKARKGEKYQKSKADAEVKKVLAQYEAEKARADALEQKIRNGAMDGALRQALSENGAKAVDTALKLVDRSAIKIGDDGSVNADSVKAVIDALKASDSILFDAVTEAAQATKTAPPAVRATEADKISGYAAEMMAAKTSKEVQAVLKKYGKA